MLLPNIGLAALTKNCKSEYLHIGAAGLSVIVIILDPCSLANTTDSVTSRTKLGSSHTTTASSGPTVRACSCKVRLDLFSKMERMPITLSLI